MTATLSGAPASGPLPRTVRPEASRFDLLLWLALIWIIGLEPMLSAPWSVLPVGWQHVEHLEVETQSLHNPSYLLITLSTLAIYALAPIAFMRAGRRDLRRPGTSLYLAGLALSCGPLLSALYGSNPSFSAGLFRLPALFTSLYYLPRPPLDWLARQVKRFVAVYVAATIGAALVFPSHVVERGYRGIIPGFDVRLHGLGQHAISLASLLVLFLILDWIAPSRSRRGRMLKFVVICCLFLTQAKVDWIAAAVILLMESAWVPRVRLGYVVALLGAAALALTGLLALSFAANALPFDQHAISHALSQIRSLTGRTTVWGITIDAWRPNPLFGYGPGLWDTAMTLKYLPLVPWGATHAESQFFQTLGQSGLVGMAGLLFYLVTLLRYGARGARSTGGAALALALTIWLRAVTDPIFLDFVGIDLLVHVVSFAVLIIAGTEAQRAVPHRASRDALADLPAPAGLPPGPATGAWMQAPEPS